MNCTYCGKPLSGNTQFCGYCGKKVKLEDAGNSGSEVLSSESLNKIIHNTGKETIIGRQVFYIALLLFISQFMGITGINFGTIPVGDGYRRISIIYIIINVLLILLPLKISFSLKAVIFRRAIFWLSLTALILYIIAIIRIIT